MELISEEQAQAVSRLTVQWLKNRGWCIWKCKALQGDLVAVVRDRAIAEEQSYEIDLITRTHDIGASIARYTVDELRNLTRLDTKTMVLTHEAKKAGAVIDSVEVTQ